MSWKDAIEDIVTDMKEEIDDLKGTEDAGSACTRNALKGYMGRLKTVLKAAGDTHPKDGFINPMLITPEIQRAAEVEKHRAEFRNKHAKKEEEYDGSMAELVDTPGEEGTSYHPIDPGMPVGARTAVAGLVYQLRRRDNKLVLVYDEVSTENAKAQLKEIKDAGNGIILGK